MTDSSAVFTTPPPAAPPFAEQGVHVMTKPIGPICNLDCEYCYYLHKEDLYPNNRSWRMNGETLETYIRQYIESQPPQAEEITFAWQGGEPTLLGLGFFERVVQLQQQLAPTGRKIVNTLQTNGVLLDDAWAAFFKQHQFLIGLSIDGPAALHDRYRFDTKGRGTFEAVLKGMQTLKRHDVDFNALVVVNRVNGDHGRKVYTYLRDNGVRYLQFIPIVERRGIGAHAEEVTDDPAPPDDGVASLVSSRSVLPEQFGRFLIEVFDEWVRRDVGTVFVQIFDQALSAWMGLEPSLCVFRRNCGRALAMEHNGDLYSCDHFVEPDYRLGNIHELPIVEMANSARQQAFGEAKSATLPQYCLDCEVRFACNGECPKNRFIETPNGDSGLNYLCAGYRSFFNHIGPTMALMARELKAGRPAANVMHVFKEKGKKQRRSRPGASGHERRPLQQVGRNDPCPCGSGRKFKKCCGS
ncbi:anaerobic sulfatase maturase [Maioricimonas rarisocia]|nr:anaerobic sulfatase maturase [Maioricimonas rarisocia]